MLEFSPAILQTVITVGLATVCLYLYRRYRKPYFAYWSIAWLLYVARLGAILQFLGTEDPIWLYWHQVVTGWTALALLWAALVFSQQIRFRPLHLIWALFPPFWSFVAIYQLDNFLAAAGPAVVFLSLATIWTGASLWKHHRRIGSNAALLLAIAFLLWGLHHLDYPFLRARGAWNPWGYYLDIVFELAVGTGFLLLVEEDIHRGLGTLSNLASDLQKRHSTGGVLRVVLERLHSLPGVTGGAVFLRDGMGDTGPSEGSFQGVGVCRDWEPARFRGDARVMIDRVLETGRPQVLPGWDREFSYAAALPVLLDQEIVGSILIVGGARDPFASLDTDFLIALGRQVGAALRNADLDEKLEARTQDLERLAARMVRQHEEERRRLSRELHDESAQVFASVKLQLGVLRENAPQEMNRTLDDVISLIEEGIRSIRAVTEDLRPSLLDDLGLLPALRALAQDFSQSTSIETRLDLPADLPALSEDAELALFRALQEGMANVAKHANAGTIDVAMRVDLDGILMKLSDDGIGMNGVAATDPFVLEGHMGLSGMRERIYALGGDVEIDRSVAAGFALRIRLPLPREDRP